MDSLANAFCLFPRMPGWAAHLGRFVVMNVGNGFGNWETLGFV